MYSVPAPLFSSNKLGLLTASYVIPSHLMGGASVGTLHLIANGREDGRQGYTYLVEDAYGVQLDAGSDLFSGTGDDVDYVSMMGALISFIANPSESYPAELIEWAEQNSDELQYARELINQNPDDHGEDCTRCQSGETAEHLPTYR